MQTVRTDIRNIAIIAHVDHGKTTLVDGLLRQAQVFRENQQVVERVMDSNDLERERGITILAKNTAVHIPDPKTGKRVKINIVDTPGHADFGGEVERVLNMVDGVLLLVDAAEGPRPQTRFVLKKALELGHKAIVVINKIDRRDADPERVLNETFDLFIELGATDEQAEFPVVYAVATTQKASMTTEMGPDLQPLYETILNEIPAPSVDLEAPLKMLVTNLDYDNYRGMTAIGRIYSGEINVGQSVARIDTEGTILPESIRYLYVFDGLQRNEIDHAQAGDIVAIAGLESISIGETLADPEFPEALPTIKVEEPTVRMAFGVNTSPFTGREGRWSTSRKIRERLFDELKNNVSLRVEETKSADTFIVSGRGELHLAILIETMRREGYELQVSRPEVIMITGEDGKRQEPFEQVHIEISQELVGTVIEMLSKRRGELKDMVESSSGTTLLTFVVPTRGMLGFRYQFLTATRGLGVMNTLFHGYGPIVGEIASRSRGSLVAWEPGTTTTFGLKNAEERGALFVSPGTEVYTGMVVGENQRPGDLDVNVCKTKHLTNMRQSVRDIEVRLTTPKDMSLDECIEYLADDELLEVTPDNLRLRKRILDAKARGRDSKRSKVSMAA
ncbi:MAG: translational GTPase TypA [Chloroflexota bacterium]